MPLPTMRETRGHCLLRKSGLFRLFTLESRNRKSPRLNHNARRFQISTWIGEIWGQVGDWPFCSLILPHPPRNTFSLTVFFETSFHECATAKGLASIEVTVRLPTIKGLQPAKAGSNSPNSRGFSRCPMSHPNHPNVPLERGLDARAPSLSTSIRDFLWWHVQVSPTH